MGILRKHCCKAALCALVTCTVVATLTGCGGSGGEASTSQARPVDPRYASADALCAEINSITADIQQAGNIVRAKELLNLIHTETPAQQRFVGIIRNIEPVVDVFEAAMTRFGQRDMLLQGMRDAMVQEGMNPDAPESASVVENSGRRAIVQFPSWKETGEALHLVEAEGRWWISGYTFEYDPSFLELMSGPDAPVVERFFQSIGREARTISDQLAAGQYATEEQFGMAILGAFMKITAENPDAQAVMKKLADKYGPPGGFAAQ